MFEREQQGVDFWWLDWQQNLTSNYIAGLSETFWCNHVFFNDMRLNRTDRRPFIFHRWGGLGSHRYPIGFSGDTYGTFGSLAFQPYFTATASNVCFGYWGHDLGGHHICIDLLHQTVEAELLQADGSTAESDSRHVQPSTVSTPTSQTEETPAVYSLDGRRRTTAVRGLNILRASNGMVRKVWK